MSTSYKKGRNNEYRTMRLLEASGYSTSRAAGSHGAFDVLGWDAIGFIFVQVKSGAWPSPAERETLKLATVPPNAKKLVHRWDYRAEQPKVMEL